MTTDLTIRHQALLQRIALGNYKDVMPFLKQMSRDLRTAILSTEGTYTRKRLRFLLAQIDDIIEKQLFKVGKRLIGDLKELATYEAEFNVKLLDRSLNVDFNRLSPEQVVEAVTTTPANLYNSYGGVETLTLPEMAEGFDANVRKEVTQTIRAGIVSGDTRRTIAKNVYNLTDTRTQRQAETLVRTATNHVSYSVRSSFAEANEKYLKGLKFVATLDGRTTLICIEKDGEIYVVGEEPSLPQHWNCRSTYVYAVKDGYRVPGYAKGRSSIDGPVDSRVTYGGWLKTQPNEFQESVLGIEKAKIFRSGKLSIDKFSDNGRTLTIKELRGLEKQLDSTL